MRIKDMFFKGFFEDHQGMTSERLQIVVPENDLEQVFLTWSILPHGETVDGDNARRGYVFHYELEDYLRDGMYRLRLTGRDASGIHHAAEIAACAISTLDTVGAKPFSFQRLWLMSLDTHFRPQKGDHFDRPAYGRLIFGGADNLPHRRLFGAAAMT